MKVINSGGSEAGGCLGTALLIAIIILAFMYPVVAIVLGVVIVLMVIGWLVGKSSNNKEIEKAAENRSYNVFLDEISDVDLSGIEGNDLTKGIRQTITEFGPRIFTDKRFVSILDDKLAFKDEPRLKPMVKFFADLNLLEKLRAIRTKDECIKTLKAYYDKGCQKFPNNRHYVVTALMSMASAVNTKYLAEALKAFDSGNEVIPAGQGHPKIIVRKDSFDKANISIHDLSVRLRPDKATFKFEITAKNVTNAAPNHDDPSSKYYVCCLYYNQRGIVIGKSVLASDFAYARLLQIVNTGVSDIPAADIDKIVFYVEKGYEHGNFDNTKGISFDDGNSSVSIRINADGVSNVSHNVTYNGQSQQLCQQPETTIIANGGGKFGSLTHLLKGDSKYLDHIRNSQATFHLTPDNKAEILLFLEYEFYGDKSVNPPDLLIYDKNNVLRQKISLENNYVKAYMYHYYTYFRHARSRLDYDQIGSLIFSDGK